MAGGWAELNGIHVGSWQFAVGSARGRATVGAQPDASARGFRSAKSERLFTTEPRELRNISLNAFDSTTSRHKNKRCFSAHVSESESDPVGVNLRSLQAFTQAPEACAEDVRRESHFASGLGGGEPGETHLN